MEPVGGLSTEGPPAGGIAKFTAKRLTGFALILDHFGGKTTLIFDHKRLEQP
jgi:hypothetical protein